MIRRYVLGFIPAEWVIYLLALVVVATAVGIFLIIRDKSDD